jgi:hypothetical protein
MGFGRGLRVREHAAEGMVEGPAVPVQTGPAASDDGRAGEVEPTSSEVTRLLCQAVYARPDQVQAVKAWWRKIRGKDKPRRSTRRRIYLEGSDDCPPLGEPMAQWVVDHVLHGPPLPSLRTDSTSCLWSRTVCARDGGGGCGECWCWFWPLLWRTRFHGPPSCGAGSSCWLS